MARTEVWCCKTSISSVVFSLRGYYVGTKTIYSSIIILLLCALVGGFFMYLITKDTLECNKNEQICVLKNNGRVIKKFPVSDIQNGLSLDVSGPQIHHSGGRAGESYDWIYSLSLQTQSGSLLLFRNVDSYECLLFGFFCPVIGGKEYDENSSAYADILSKKEQIETFPKNANKKLNYKIVERRGLLG